MTEPRRMKFGIEVTDSEEKSVKILTITANEIPFNGSDEEFLTLVDSLIHRLNDTADPIIHHFEAEPEASLVEEEEDEIAQHCRILLRSKMNCPDVIGIRAKCLFFDLECWTRITHLKRSLSKLTPITQKTKDMALEYAQVYADFVYLTEKGEPCDAPSEQNALSDVSLRDYQIELMDRRIKLSAVNHKLTAMTKALMEADILKTAQHLLTQNQKRKDDILQKFTKIPQLPQTKYLYKMKQKLELQEALLQHLDILRKIEFSIEGQSDRETLETIEKESSIALYFMMNIVNLDRMIVAYTDFADIVNASMVEGVDAVNLQKGVSTYLLYISIMVDTLNACRDLLNNSIKISPIKLDDLQEEALFGPQYTFVQNLITKSLQALQMNIDYYLEENQLRRMAAPIKAQKKALQHLDFSSKITLAAYGDRGQMIRMQKEAKLETPVKQLWGPLHLFFQKPESVPSKTPEKTVALTDDALMRRKSG